MFFLLADLDVALWNVATWHSELQRFVECMVHLSKYSDVYTS